MFRGVRAQRIPGMVGSALGLDGKTQFAEIPVSAKGLDVGEEDFSVEFWLRTTETRIRNIVDKRDKTPRGYLVFIQRGRIGVQVIADANYSYLKNR